MKLIIELLEIIFGFFKIIVLNPPLLILFSIIIVLELLYPKIRGIIGEFWVRLELKRLPKNDYIVLNDIMLQDENGTHQIDHLVISKYGIFVIEMKNYYGLIVGEDYKNHWIQYLGKNKYYFKNPVYQNYGHIKAIDNLLKLDKENYISIICFSNQTQLRVKTKNTVIQLDYLIKTIKSFYKLQINSNIYEIASKIEIANITDKTKRKKHIKNIREKVKCDNLKADNMICPKCGSELLFRNGKYGTFKGCSKYPKCKYIKK